MAREEALAAIEAGRPIESPDEKETREDRLKTPQPAPEKVLTVAERYRLANKRRRIQLPGGYEFLLRPLHPLETFWSMFAPFGIRIEGNESPERLDSLTKELQKKILDDQENYDNIILSLACVEPKVILSGELGENELLVSEISKFDRRILLAQIIDMMGAGGVAAEVARPFPD